MRPKGAGGRGGIGMGIRVSGLGEERGSENRAERPVIESSSSESESESESESSKSCCE